MVQLIPFCCTFILYPLHSAVCLLEEIWYELMITALSYQHPDGDFVLCPYFNLVSVFVSWGEEASSNVDTWYTLLVQWSTAWFFRPCMTKSAPSTWGSCCVSVKQTLLWTKGSFFYRMGQWLGQDPSLTNSNAAHRRFIVAKTNMSCRGPDLWNLKTPGCRCILKSGLLVECEFYQLLSAENYFSPARYLMATQQQLLK